MKRKDQIELFKERQFSFRYNADGLIDICLGLILILIWLGFKLSNPLLFFVIIVFLPLLITIFKKKLVYPRLGKAQFTDKKKQNRQLYILLYTVFIGLGLCIMHVFTAYQSIHGVCYPLLYGLWTIAGGLFVYGSISQNHLLYVIALSLIFPMGSSHVPDLMWFGMPMSIIYNVTIITIISFLLMYKKPIISKQEVRRPNLVIHLGFLLLGLVIIAGVCLSAFLPDLYLLTRQRIVEYPWITLSYGIAIITFCLGFAIKTPRYYLYAILMCLMTTFAAIFTGNTGTMGVAIAIAGMIIMLSGILVLNNFIRSNPLLQEIDDELPQD